MADVLTVVEVAVFPAAVWVLVTFGISVFGMIWRGEQPEVGDVMMTGVFAAWSANAGLRLWSTIFRIEDSPEWMINHYTMSYLLLGYVIGAVLHVSASGAVRKGPDEPYIPRRSWIVAGGLAAAGAAIGLLMIWLDAHNWLHARASGW